MKPKSPLPESTLLWAEAAQDSVPAVPLTILFCTELLPSLEGQMCWLLCICCQLRVELAQKQGDGPQYSVIVKPRVRSLSNHILLGKTGNLFGDKF